MTFSHADGGKAGGDPSHSVIELPPAHPQGCVGRGHVDHGDRVIAAATVEAVPQRHEFRMLDVS